MRRIVSLPKRIASWPSGSTLWCRQSIRRPHEHPVGFGIALASQRLGEHQLKFELFNAFNHPQSAGPGSSIDTATAGVISSLLFNSPMRQIQIAMKLSF